MRTYSLGYSFFFSNMRARALPDQTSQAWHTGSTKLPTLKFQKIPINTAGQLRHVGRTNAMLRKMTCPAIDSARHDLYKRHGAGSFDPGLAQFRQRILRRSFRTLGAD